jgi:glutathione S-transferase
MVLELDHTIELVSTSGHASPPHLLAANPLSKVPCLITDDGTALFDSPVICDYLDSLSDTLPLIPPAGANRWRVLKQEALGDGIMDAAVQRRSVLAREQDDYRRVLTAKLAAVIERSLDWLEANLPRQTVDIGSIAIACALGYLDFRFPHEPWRDARPKLAAWFEKFSQLPALANTVPKEPA